MSFNIKLHSIWFLPAAFCIITSCNKLIEVNAPGTQLGSSSVYNDSSTANSAVLGMYSYVANADRNDLGGFGDYVTFLNPLSSDEAYYFPSTLYDEFKNNNLLADNATLLTLWSFTYNAIYNANAVMEGASASTSLSPSFRKQIIGESKFIRALCYFYLVNEFGDVPLVMTTDPTVSGKMARTSQALVYQQIVQDLSDAQDSLPSGFSTYQGARTRATSWAAEALLARVQLYLGNWQAAESLAGDIINNGGLFQLVQDPTKVFLAGSQEGILQFISGIDYVWITAQFIPPVANGNNPQFVLNDGLLQAFETGDARRSSWVGSVIYNGVNYWYPAKYKSTSSSVVVEYNQVLRLAEQYLIRAEARAEQGKIADAQSDLNTIRSRAGLGATPASDKPGLLAAIEQERRVEFFCEWGHRWLDLKREKGFTNPSVTRADEVLGPIKTGWKPTDVLYPIPQVAISTNPTLTQNQGYN